MSDRPKQRTEAWVKKISAIAADERTDAATRKVAEATLHRIIEPEPMPGWFTFHANWTSTRSGLHVLQTKSHRFLIRETKSGRWVWTLFNRTTRESRHCAPGTTYQTMEEAMAAAWREKTLI